MRVAVDTATCDRHGQCVMAAPAVFSFGPAGDLLVQEIISPDDAEAVQDAAMLCPVQAIRVSASLP